MRVVSAGVHHAHLLAPVLGRRRGSKRQIGDFGHRQRIHVRPYRHQRALPGTAQVPDHPRVRDPGLHLEPHVPQRVGDHLGGAKLPVAEFGVLVEVPPPGDDLRFTLRRKPIDQPVLGVGGLKGQAAGCK